MVTAMSTKELRPDGIVVNAAHGATDLNGHRGWREAVEGARVGVHLATLPGDGVLPW
jgi:hypothetical protein